MAKTNEITSDQWCSGPDALCPASSFTTTRLDGAVKLRLTQNEKYKPVSFYTVFKTTVNARPQHPAIAYKERLGGDRFGKQWIHKSYQEYWDTCHQAAKSFISLGLNTSECVSIIGFNSPEWIYSHLGAIFAGGIGCGIYATNSSEVCEHIVKDNKTRIVVAENKKQLNKFLEFKDRVNLKAIIVYAEEPENDHNGLVMSWSKFIELGKDVADSQVEERIKTLAPNKCCSLIYTSGTTGVPKAAMLSHDNCTYVCAAISYEFLELRSFGERLISFLPLSHIAAQYIDIYAPIYNGLTVYFAQPDALKGSLVQTMQEVRPTYFFGVPRVWEKIQEKVQASLNELPPTKQRLIKWARKAAYKDTVATFETNVAGSRLRNGKNTLSSSLAKSLVLKKIHAKLGLDQCWLLHSSGAPIAKETLDFFISLGLPMSECFGMSETAAPHSIGKPKLNRVASVGICNYNGNSRTRIANKDDNGCGEVQVTGRQVFMGYLNDEQKTREAFEGEGWLKTGDIGRIDEDNFLFITGRLKELIITAGGENIAPVPIENNVKAELPNLISNCMLIGDKKKFITLLVTIKSKIDSDSLSPLDELTEDCIEWLRSIGSSSTKVSDIVDNKDPLVYQQIEKGIKRANAKSPSNAAIIQKFQIVEKDFSLANGELGPTLKLRRPRVLEIYSKVIDSMYLQDTETEKSK